MLPSAEVVPSVAVPALRAADAVFADPSVPAQVAASCGAEPLPAADELARRAESSAVVVLTCAAGVAAAEPAERVLPGAAVLRAAEPAGSGLLAAAEVMDRLRSPGGCPWDAEQTHESLRRYLLEETYELLEAIDGGDRDALREELGDVLLQVLFHARIAAEDPSAPFDIDDVAAGLAAKLVRRHPHVFATDEAVYDAESQERRWAELKAAEKPRTSVVDGVVLAQPALSLAAALARRAARAGVAVPEPSGTGVGDRLFAIAAEAAADGEDPELALREVARRFATRLRSVASG